LTLVTDASTEHASPEVEIPEVMGDGPGRDGHSDEPEAAVREPARVMRIGSMIRQLMEEVREAPLDEASRDRLRAIYETSVQELGESLSDDLRDELSRLALPFDAEGTPTEAELRIAQAQLVGWLEGLFHGMQAALFAQQMAARQQLEQMRGQGQLPPGQAPPRGPGDPPPGVYL
jgi:Bacterial proteasome activator